MALTADSMTHLGGTVLPTPETPGTAPVRDWRDTAACRDTDPDLFFPVGSTGLAAQQIIAAKAVCEACASKALCLQFAIENNQDSGVWGGTSEEERRTLRRAWVKQRKAAACSA